MASQAVDEAREMVRNANMVEHDVDPRVVAAQLRALLAEIDAGRLVASPVERARIEGAAVACDVIVGDDVSVIVDRLHHPG